jgi:hypothetical protein
LQRFCRAFTVSPAPADEGNDETPSIINSLGHAPTGVMGGTPTARLPYPMQLGLDTFDLEPGIAYRGKNAKFCWGAQLTGTVRLGLRRL